MMLSYKTGILMFALLLIFSGCRTNRKHSKAHADAEMLFQTEIEKPDVHNAFLGVYSPSHNIDWNFADGKFKDGEKVTTANPFYTASIGKTFTAVAIALLKEQNKLNFDDKIGKYLPDDVMKNLHVFEGTDYSEQITIAQLLQHTSGLPDYFEGKTTDGSQNMMQQIFTDSAKFWEPKKIIQFTKDKMKPGFRPGKKYNYTDTEYILLGMIIENVSKMKLHEFFREQFFEPLEMKHTWMYLRSQPIEKTGQMAEIYVGNFGISNMTSLSADWAGGGLVSTADDLIKFQYALNTGKIISKKTLQQMKQWKTETVGMYYGYGLRKIVFKELFNILPGVEAIGHSGSTGSFMYYCPQLDVYLAGTLDQSAGVKNTMLLTVKLLAVLKHEFHTNR